MLLVNGLPASGKSTLAARLGSALAGPVLSKDGFKEALADALDTPLTRAEVGRAAMECLWAAAAGIRGLVVVDAWLFRPRDRDHAVRGLARAGGELVAEIWCDVPVDVAAARYASRTRHPVHDDRRDMTDDWRRWAAEAEPLGIGRVVRVDTTGPIDVMELVAAIVEAIQGADPSAPRAPQSRAGHGGGGESERGGEAEEPGAKTGDGGQRADEQGAARIAELAADLG